MKFTLLSASFLAGIAFAAPHTRQDYAVKEVHNPPRAWKRVCDAPSDHVLQISIGLKQHLFAELESHLLKSSDPSHNNYGDHLSADQVRKLVAPSNDTLSAVHEWLAYHGVEGESLSYSPAKDWISVSLPVDKVEELLDTKYSVYEHGADGDQLVRTTQWSLPQHLHEHVDLVQPTNSFFRPETLMNAAKRDKMIMGVDTFPLDSPVVTNANVLAAQNADADIDTVCNTTLLTPTCFRTIYGTLNYTPQVPDKNHVGINNFLREVSNRSDTILFLQQFRPEAAGNGSDFERVIIANGSNYQGQENATDLKAGLDIEGNLDAETVVGITWPTRLTTYNTGGSARGFKSDAATLTNNNEPYLTWTNAVLAMDNLPYTISTSYADDEQTVPHSYAKKVCDGFAQLGARGISLFFASGDRGVGHPDDCFSNDGRNTSTFLPMFPATCPYVTSVGATMNFSPEIVANDTRNGFVSGGGFSNYFPRPAYQKSAVDSYVSSLGDTFAGLYNTTGRGVPDLAAQGYRFAVVWNGTVKGVDGTSASTPLLSGVFTLVNDALIAAGKPTLGFLNPWLYAEGYKVLTDITIGSSAGCNTNGFPAQEGWDAATGFGTPNFERLVENAMECGNNYH